ncbi:hypothetical protein V7S43_013539 [Phytophthora oleae]|uniref:Uncharacterized protein n=1 Tax=Phytophthora oleae TaxID=2107226 RepID=A0ABD3F4Y7_9STRA
MSSLTTAAAFDETMRDVFSLRDAIPVLDEYLMSNQIGEDYPGFLLSWDVDNLKVFVDVANTMNPGCAPSFLQTLPPKITTHSFSDGVVRLFKEQSGGWCGRVLLAPNDQSQFVRIVGRLADIQGDIFVQNVAQAAFKNDSRHLATTYNLITIRAQESVRNHLPRPLDGGCIYLAR